MIIPSHLIQKKIDLYPTLGIHDLAWSYLDAIEVLKHCKDKQVFVYGGDVLKVTEDAIEFTYDNWSTDNVSELNCIIAADISIQYIENYPHKEKHIYTIVIKNL